MTGDCKLAPANFLVYSIFFTILSANLGSCHVNEKRQLYIVYMGSLPEKDYSPTEHHQSILQKVVTDSLGHRRLYQSYKRSFNGFAAWLNNQEIDRLNDMEEVLSVFPSQNFELQTTRSWDFMGFPENMSGDPTLGSDIIIGVMDSGIWPGLASFSDAEIGPVPKKWRGTCQGGPDFECNRKIIGAKFYERKDSATDDKGHGTHTASTAAGNKVRGASFHDVLAKGTARGGLPSSRIAAYKVCRMGLCSSANILAGFDDAIADGVDVITISLSSRRPVELAQDPIAIGSFHAMKHGIATVNSAGNYGPNAATINEIAPWLVSVGASTIDRFFADKLVLGDGTTLTGTSSINVYPLGREPKFPLVYANKLNASICSESLIRECSIHCVDEDWVKGKILMCTSTRSQMYLRRIGAAGVIYKGYTNIPTIYLLPAISLPSQDFAQVETYANISGSRATILESEDEKDTLAPAVAWFSSRGPNYRFPDIMKPDVVAPGVGILAAYVPQFLQSIEAENNESMAFNIMSGTSMACPHAAGAIAYVKSQHPAWSPSALKSALMTTARPLNASMQADREFAYGSGHINPLKAADPGLIYDISEQDYIDLLCGTYNEEICHKISSEECRCPKDKTAPKDLNYPSMTIMINSSEPINVSFTRVVTNVGHPNSTYKAAIVAAPKLTITVAPDTLSFTELNEKKSFEVHVTGEFPRGERMLSSSLVWSHGTHNVRSPIIVYAN